MWNPYLHPDRIFNYREVEGKRTTWFDETDQLSVDPEKACAFITCIYPTMMVESRHYSAADSATFWLNEEIVTLPAGHAHRYQEIALRNRYFANLAERFDLATPEEMNAYPISRSRGASPVHHICCLTVRENLCQKNFGLSRALRVDLITFVPR